MILERNFRAAQAAVASMPASERSDAVWRQMRRLAEDDASGVVVVTYFAVVARLAAEGIVRATLSDIAVAVGIGPGQLARLLDELIDRQALLIETVQDVVLAVPVFEFDRGPRSAALH